MVKQKCFALKKFYFIETLISSNSLQQEISAMVKQKYFVFEEVLLHRKSDIFFFSATRNQCNGETEMSLKKSSISLQWEISAMVKGVFSANDFANLSKLKFRLLALLCWLSCLCWQNGGVTQNINRNSFLSSL